MQSSSTLNGPQDTGMTGRISITNMDDDYDYDSEYANHPPPTDSEAEIEFEILPTYNQYSNTGSTSAATHRRPSLSSPFRANNGRTSNNLVNAFSNNHLFQRPNIIPPIPTSAPSVVGSTSNSITPMVRNRSGSISRTNSRTTLADEELSIEDQIIMFGSQSTATNDLRQQRNHLKELGLKRLKPREHFLVSMGRDISLLILCKYLYILWKNWYVMLSVDSSSEYRGDNLTSVKSTEFFLAGVWCIVSAFLSYSILDGLMARWIVMYSVQAVIVRVMSMSLFIVVLVELLSYMFNNKENQFCLPTWIVISCVMTLIYIIQSFVVSNLTLDEHLLNRNGESLTSSEEHSLSELDGIRIERGESLDLSPHTLFNLDVNINLNNNNNNKNKNKNKNKKKQKIGRTVDLYNITVFAVVPIGVASFITMIGLIRLLLILRLEIDLEFNRIMKF